MATVIPDNRSQSVLDDNERTLLIDIIESFQSVATTEEFITCINGSLQQILPHQSLLCAIGNMTAGNIKLVRVLPNNFPEKYVKALSSKPSIKSPIVDKWLSSKEPQLFDADIHGCDVYSEWLDQFTKHGFKNIVAFGVADVQGIISSFFGFYNVPEIQEQRHVYLLRMLVPHMHMALINVLSIEDEAQTRNALEKAALSERQINILNWMQQGKTNWEIAQIMGMTVSNVKYHTKTILNKLNANNRTQAVSKVMITTLKGENIHPRLSTKQ